MELYYLCSENKDTDQLLGYPAFAFVYSKSKFSHDTSQFVTNNTKPEA